MITATKEQFIEFVKGLCEKDYKQYSIWNTPNEECTVETYKGFIRFILVKGPTTNLNLLYLDYTRRCESKKNKIEQKLYDSLTNEIIEYNNSPKDKI
jgi:hypothetical protein